MSSDAPAPCQICGAPAVERQVGVDQRLGGVSLPIVKRVCTSPECASNTGRDLRLTQAV